MDEDVKAIVEPKDQREFDAGLEVHTPNWLPGAKLDVRFKRVWERRAEDFLQRTARSANLSRSELLELMEFNDGDAVDLLVRAGQRSSERGDVLYRSALAQLIAAALTDDSKVDTVAYIVDRIIGLEPVHIRILSLLPYLNTEAAAAAGNALAIAVQADYPRHGVIDSRRGRIIREPDRSLPLSRDSRVLLVDSYSHTVRADSAVVDVCFEELADLRFLSSTDDARGYRPTALGILTANLIQSNPD